MKLNGHAVARVKDAAMRHGARCPACSKRILVGHRTLRQDGKTYHRSCLRYVRS